MTDNNRIYYGCQAVNLWSNDRISNHQGFLSGVQSLGLDSTFENISIIDYGRPNPAARLYKKPIFNLTIDRLIAKQGELFLKTDTDLISGMYNNPRAEHDVLIIYGKDTELFVQSDKINDLMLFKNMLLTSLSYNISTTSPSISESMSFTGRIQKKESSEIETLVSPEYAGRTDADPDHGMVRRNDYRNHNLLTNPSILPETVKEWIDFTSGLTTEKQFYGLTSIEISTSINYKELTDVGKWRGAIPSQVNLYNIPILPLEINCTFRVNAKRSMRKDLVVSDSNFTDEEIKIITGTFCFNLGEKNRLVSINKSGGSTSGDVVEYEIGYNNVNYLRIDSLT